MILGIFLLYQCLLPPSPPPRYHYEETFFLPTFPIKIWIALNGIRISIIFEKQKQMCIFKLEKM